jgi:hypothetical protein
MKYLVFTLAALSLSLVTSCSKNGGSQKVQANTTTKKIKVILLWCDVTSSLKDLESEEVSSLASAVLDHFPQGTKYVLYPIQTETGRPVAIIKSGPSLEDLSSNDNSDGEAPADVDRATFIKDEIKRLYKLNKEKHPDDRRTCILNALDVSAKFFSQFDERYDPELVFVSDMIEDCRNTPLHQSVHLDKQPFAKTIKLVDSFASPPNLSKLRITIIVPTAKDTSTVPAGQRPDPRDLERFWKTVFVKCRFNQNDLTNNERFYWSPEGLPERFKQ